MSDRPNYITPAGYAALRAEYEQLLGIERPAIVEVVSWAAGNGDRSENGDYIYGRKRLREIDRRLGFLSRRMKAASVIDPAAQPDRERVWFGAMVTILDEGDASRVLTLIGDDEANAGAGQIGWSAPFARALRGAAVGDRRRVTLPVGEREVEVLAIAYPRRRGTPACPRPFTTLQRVCDMAENPRTTSARDHDDTDLIEGMDPEVDAVAGAAGGKLQRDVGSQADLTRAVADPEADTRAEKADDMANDQSYPADRR